MIHWEILKTSINSLRWLDVLLIISVLLLFVGCFCWCWLLVDTLYEDKKEG